MNAKIFEENFQVDERGQYLVPPIVKQGGRFWLEHEKIFAESYPVNDACYIFGLHQNAEISVRLKESSEFLDLITPILARKQFGASKKKDNHEESWILDFRQILANIPERLREGAERNFDAFDKYEVFQNILRQEVQRYNLLLEVFRRTIQGALSAAEA